MRSERDVQDRIRYLLSLELDRRVAAASARLPASCRHHYQHFLDTRKEVADQRNERYNRVAEEGVPGIGLCMLGAADPMSWAGTICEDPIDARRCPYFTSRVTKEAVEQEFETQLHDLEWVSANLPEVYGLLWALGSTMAPRLPWWKVLWFRFLQIRPDPIEHVEPALPSGGES